MPPNLRELPGTGVGTKKAENRWISRFSALCGSLRTSFLWSYGDMTNLWNLDSIDLP